MNPQTFRSRIAFAALAAVPRDRAERIAREVRVHGPDERVPLPERTCFLCGHEAQDLVLPWNARTPVQEPLCRPCARDVALVADAQLAGKRPAAEMMLADAVRALRAQKEETEDTIAWAERILSVMPQPSCWSCGLRFDARPIVGGARPICLECVERYRRMSCPCCGYATLENRADFLICPVCFWEDDGQDDDDAGDVRGGPNGGLSLDDARRNYLRWGAWHEDALGHVRRPIAREPQLRRYELAAGAVVRAFLD